jgi:hypothetical protein
MEATGIYLLETGLAFARRAVALSVVMTEAQSEQLRAAIDGVANGPTPKANIHANTPAVGG